MLQSKFVKKNDKFNAQKIFTDRVEPRAVYKKSVEEWDDKQQEIITYYGKGGIGKSKLLKSLLQNSDIEGIRAVFVSLDAYEYSNPVNILMSIRNRVVGDCGLFDYALVQYCSKAKISVEEIMRKSDCLSSPVMDVINEVISLGTMSACIPTSIMKKCVSFVKDLHFKNKYKQEIEELDDLNEFEIFERLPFYLGTCLSYAATKGNRHVIFLDSYDSVLLRSASMTPSVGNEDWLKELFLSSETIRIVIASRDKLRWEKEDSEWKEYLNQHLLENLSDEDSRWFLEQVPVTNEEAIKSIISHAGGVPLYLDMSVDIWEQNVNNDLPFDLTPLQKGEKIIDRYIRHLHSKDKYAIKVLTMPRFFDQDYAMELLKMQNLMYNKEDILELLEKSIILPIEEQKGLYKVDESVRLHIHAQNTKNKKKEVTEQMLLCAKNRKGSSAFPYFAMVLEIFKENPEYLNSLIQQVLEMTEYYSSAGFWNELHNILSDYIQNENDDIKTLAVFEELLFLRRIGNLKEAEKLAKRIPLNKDKMGEWFYFYRYLVVQIDHLRGYYDESLLGYQKLLKEMDLIKTCISAHIYNQICMKYADLLFLKGNFEESMKMVDDILNKNGTLLVEQVELLRIKGHIYRFQNNFQEARLIYEAALALVTDHGLRAYEGKLATNMTETLCMLSPQDALYWFEKSEKENRKSGNDIELGKAQAAVSVAYTKIGMIDEAITHAKMAVITAEKTGYRAGKVFALAALCYAYGEGEQSTAETYSLLKELVDEINVYHYIVQNVNCYLESKEEIR